MYKWGLFFICIGLCWGCQNHSEHKDVVAKPVPAVPELASLDGGRVMWRSWAHRDSARIIEKPILLFLYNPRSFWCQDLAKRCFQDRELAREIMRIAWPIWVNVDKQPDVYERFGLGGVPTIAFLKHTGEWISGGTYLDPEDFMDLLRRVSFPYANPKRMDALESQRKELQRRATLWARQNPRPEIPLSQTLLTRMLDSLQHAVNRGVDVGGEAARALFETRQSEGGLQRWLDTRQDDDGVFFLYAHTDDGKVVDREKHLGVNAGMLQALATAGQKQVAYRKAGVLLGEALLRDFRVGPLFGAGFASFETVDGIPRDSAVYASWNGLAISGLIRLYDVTQDVRYRDAAVEALDAVVTTFGRADGMLQHEENALSGVLLEDQAFVARAALDVYDATQDLKYLQLAKQLADGMVTHFGADGLALRDRAEVTDPVYVYADGWIPAGNGVAAQVFMRLHQKESSQLYLAKAEDILRSLLGPHVDEAMAMGALTRALQLYLNANTGV